MVQTKPHDRFERDGDNLKHKCSVSLQEALTGVNKAVLSLDNRTITIRENFVNPNTRTVVRGEGVSQSVNL